MSRLRAATCCLALLAASAQGLAGSPAAVAKGKFCPHRATTAHFVIEFSLPEDTGSVYADLCEKAYKRFSGIFDVDRDEVVWQGKCYVFLFRNRAEFVRFAAAVHGRTAAISGGYTTISKKNPVIVLFLNRDDHTKLQQTLVHEMTHVFLELFRTKGRIRTWLHEGFAQYFEFKHKPGRSRLALSRRIVKAMVSANATRPLAGFWTAYFPPTDVAGYAQAWSLVDFMATSKKRTGKFIIKIKQGRSQEQALKEAFGLSREQLEAKWKRHVLKTY